MSVIFSPPSYMMSVKWSGRVAAVFQMAVTSPHPPRVTTVAMGTTTSAMTMSIPWSMSVQQTALNPPRKV